MREVLDEEGRRWRGEIVSHGRTSEYLHRRVHRPVVQFTCLDQRLPTRYAPLEGGRELSDLDEEAWRALFGRAVTH